MNIIDLFSMTMIAAGVFFFFTGTLGMVRFPDIFSRLHALTKADNLGLGLIAIGLLPQMESWVGAAQLLLIWVIAIKAGAVSSYLIANYALTTASEPDHNAPDHSAPNHKERTAAERLNHGP
jgi:multicomponent Na+:H+ antiporter subunit G